MSNESSTDFKTAISQCVRRSCFYFCYIWGRYLDLSSSVCEVQLCISVNVCCTINPFQNEDRAISLIDESWKPGADDSSDVVFGQLVPYMHCVKILHRILLYMVYGIHPDLSQKYIDHLNMFMLSPCVHGTGWIQYSDVMDMIPLKILGMIMEKNAYKARYKSLGSTLYTSFEPLGVAHPIIRSSIVTNDTIVSRVWCWVKILGSLGLMTFLKPEKLGERRRPGFVYVSRTAAFYGKLL